MDPRTWHSMIKTMPTFYADRNKGTTWRQHRAQIILWKDLHDPDTTQTIDLYKKAIAYTLKGQASRAIELHGPGTPSFTAAQTIEPKNQVVPWVVLTQPPSPDSAQ